MNVAMEIVELTFCIVKVDRWSATNVESVHVEQEMRKCRRRDIGMREEAWLEKAISNDELAVFGSEPKLSERMHDVLRVHEAFGSCWPKKLGSNDSPPGIDRRNIV